MDVTPAVPQGRQVVESYGDGRFKVSGTHHEGSILVHPDQTLPWTAADMAGVTIDSLAPLLDAAGGTVEVLILGCGPEMAPIPAPLRQALRAQGIVLEPMDTGAACRTYNVLLLEDRAVAAALIAVA